MNTTPGLNAWPPPPTPPPIFGAGSLNGDTSSFPINDRDCLRVDANSLSVPGPRMCTPTSKPPVTINDALPSATAIFAACKMAMICPPKAKASPSIAYEFTKTAWPRNVRQTSAIFFCWSRLRLLGAIIASSRRFSAFSPSASLRNCPVSRFINATSSSLSLCNSAFLLPNSAPLPRSTPLMDVIFIPTPSSPTIPSVISRTLAISITNLAVRGLPGLA
jgi:hypothetical protein